MSFEDQFGSPPQDDEPEIEQTDDGDTISLEEIEERTGLKLLTLDELFALRPPKPLVKEIINTGTLAMLSGPPRSFKSFVAVGIACAVAHPSIRMWADTNLVEEHGPVVYIASEDGEGILPRFMAWCEANAVDWHDLIPNLYPIVVPTQLGREHPTHRAWLKARMSEIDNIKLIVVDTKARSTSGVEENSSTEQGEVIDILEEIRRETGAAILVVHHSKREGGSPRGSSAWEGAVGIDLRIEREDEASHAFKIHCAKRKSEPDGCDHGYRVHYQDIRNEWRRPDTEFDMGSLVVIGAQDANGESGGRAASDRTDEKMWNLLHDTDSGDGIAQTVWFQMAEENGISKTTAYRSAKRLQERAFVTKQVVGRSVMWSCGFQWAPTPITHAELAAEDAELGGTDLEE